MKKQIIFLFSLRDIFSTKDIISKGLNNNICESELIAKLYIQYGIDFIKNLDGFFCILIFDQKKRMLFAINDHIGSESIYFHKSSEYFSISSDINLIRDKYSLESLDNKRIYSFFELVHSSGNETF